MGQHRLMHIDKKIYKNKMENDKHIDKGVHIFFHIDIYCIYTYARIKHPHTHRPTKTTST